MLETKKTIKHLDSRRNLGEDSPLRKKLIKNRQMGYYSLQWSPPGFARPTAATDRQTHGLLPPIKRQTSKGELLLKLVLLVGVLGIFAEQIGLYVERGMLKHACCVHVYACV